jgi:hypothetical protein
VGSDEVFNPRPQSRLAGTDLIEVSRTFRRVGLAQSGV